MTKCAAMIAVIAMFTVLLQVRIPEIMVAERLDTGEVIDNRQQLAALFFTARETWSSSRRYRTGSRFFSATQVSSLAMASFSIWIPFICRPDLIRINDAAGKGRLAGHHHVVDFVAVRQLHVPVRPDMAIIVFDILPAVDKQAALIVEADEKIFRPPAKSVTDMNRAAHGTG